MQSRILFVFVLVINGITTPLTAQTEQKQSFSLSYHPITMNIVKDNNHSPYMHNDDLFYKLEFEAVMGEYGYKAVGYDPEKYGAMEFAYKRILNRQLQFHLGFSCELSSKHWDLYDRPDGPRLKRIMDYRINLMPGMDLFLLNRKWTKLWLSGQVGGQWVHRGMEYFDSNERNWQKFVWQFWFVFDQKIDDKFSINVGTGYGTLGLLKLGTSYHF
jgi:hypothetical protein